MRPATPGHQGLRSRGGAQEHRQGCGPEWRVAEGSGWKTKVTGMKETGAKADTAALQCSVRSRLGLARQDAEAGGGRGSHVCLWGAALSSRLWASVTVRTCHARRAGDRRGPRCLDPSPDSGR